MWVFPDQATHDNDHQSPITSMQTLTDCICKKCSFVWYLKETHSSQNQPNQLLLGSGSEGCGWRLRSSVQQLRWLPLCGQNTYKQANNNECGMSWPIIVWNGGKAVPSISVSHLHTYNYISKLATTSMTYYCTCQLLILQQLIVYSHCLFVPSPQHYCTGSGNQDWNWASLANLLPCQQIYLLLTQAKFLLNLKYKGKPKSLLKY